MINAIIQAVKTAEVVAKGQLCEISTKGRLGGIGKICCESTIKTREEKAGQNRPRTSKTMQKEKKHKTDLMSLFEEKRA